MVAFQSARSEIQETQGTAPSSPLPETAVTGTGIDRAALQREITRKQDQEPEKEKKDPSIYALKIQDPTAAQVGIFDKIITFVAEADEQVVLHKKHTDGDGFLNSLAQNLSTLISPDAIKSNIPDLDQYGRAQQESTYTVIERLPDGKLKYTIGVYENFQQNSGELNIKINGQELDLTQNEAPETKPIIQVPENRAQTNNSLTISAPAAGQEHKYHQTISFTASSDQQVNLVSMFSNTSQSNQLSSYISPNASRSNVSLPNVADIQVERTSDGLLKYTLQVANSFENRQGHFKLSIGNKDLEFDASGQELAKNNKTQEAKESEESMPSAPKVEPKKVENETSTVSVVDSKVTLNLPADVAVNFTVYSEQGQQRYKHNLSLDANQPNVTGSSFETKGLKFETRRQPDNSVQYTIDLADTTRVQNGILRLEMGAEVLSIDTRTTPPKVIPQSATKIEGASEWETQIVQASQEKPVFLLIGNDRYAQSLAMSDKLEKFVAANGGANEIALATIDVHSKVNQTELNQDKKLWQERVPVLRVYYRGEELSITPNAEQDIKANLPKTGISNDEELGEILEILNQLKEQFNVDQVI